jgi:hypothetical protein
MCHAAPGESPGSPGGTGIGDGRENAPGEPFGRPSPLKFHVEQSTAGSLAIVPPNRIVPRRGVSPTNRPMSGESATQSPVHGPNRGPQAPIRCFTWNFAADRFDLI